jgi:PAS domain S-box-containing protein
MLPTLDLAAVFDRLPNALMVLDHELRYVAANPAYVRATGSRLEDLVGRGIFEVFPDTPENTAILRASFRRVLETRAVDEIAAITYRVARGPSLPPEERVWSARHTPILADDGEVAFIVQETADISHLRAEQAMSLLHSAVIDRALKLQSTATLQDVQLRSLRQMFAQAPGFMCYLSGPEHVFEIVNRAYLQLVGHRDVIGMRVRDALPEVVGQGFIELLDRVASSGEPFLGRDRRVLLQRTPGGPPEDSYVDFIYQPIRDGAGQVAGIFVQGQDVTAQHRAEEERRVAEARRRS